MTTFPLKFKFSVIFNTEKNKNKDLDKAIESLSNVNLTEEERDKFFKSQKDNNPGGMDENI